MAPPQMDPRQHSTVPLRPAPWSTSLPGTFAHRTLAVRVPAILDDMVEANRAEAAFGPEQLAACRALHAEITGGKLRALTDGGPDRASWDVACAPHLGKSWLDLPWYFAESYFYRRILEAVGYFGPRRGEDPFLFTKRAEEEAMWPRVEAARQALPAGPSRLQALLLRSLWGNRADLSYAVGRGHGEVGGAADLLVDDSEAVLALLAQPQRVAVLLDNAGTELSFDLLLAEALAGAGHEVVLYAKAQPFFVSDATPIDVERTRLALGLAALPVVAHPFMTSSGFLFTDEMPKDLVAELENFNLVIAKGDANYRRLVGDAPWPPSTPVAAAMSFPAPVVAVRTCKSDVVVGVEPGVEAQARARNLDWLTTGQFGMVQLCAG